jgi:hypothetical protein
MRGSGPARRPARAAIPRWYGPTNASTPGKPPTAPIWSASGALVTAYALGIAIGGPLLTVLTARVDRRLTLWRALGGYVAANLLIALAAGFGLLFAALPPRDRCTAPSSGHRRVRRSDQRVPVTSTRATGVVLPVREEEVEVRAGRVRLAGCLTVPESACGFVVFALAGGSSRHSARNRFMATVPTISRRRADTPTDQGNVTLSRAHEYPMRTETVREGPYRYRIGPEGTMRIPGWCSPHPRCCPTRRRFCPPPRVVHQPTQAHMIRSLTLIRSARFGDCGVLWPLPATAPSDRASRSIAFAAPSTAPSTSLSPEPRPSRLIAAALLS